MIKAKKGLMITLFAALMIFAFGATSAFATEEVDGYFKWSEDLKTATLAADPSVSVNADWTFQQDGLTIAAVEYTDENGVSHESHRAFFDFNNAELDLGATMSSTYYASLNGKDAKVILKQNDAELATGAAKKVSVTLGSDGYIYKNGVQGKKAGWAVSYKTDNTVESGPATVVAVLEAVEDAGYDGMVDASYNFVTTGTSPNFLTHSAKKFGAIANKEVTVNAGAVVGSDGNWFYVKNGAAVNLGQNGATAALHYDGNEYAVTAPKLGPYKNVSPSAIEKWDAENAAWVAVEAVTFGHADDPAKYRAKYLISDDDGNVSSQTSTITIDVNGATQPVNSDGLEAVWTAPNVQQVIWMGGSYYEVTAEQAANPEQFIEFTNGFVKSLGGNEDADLDTIKAYFKEGYEVKVTKNEIDPNHQTWKIVNKTLTAADVNNIKKTYAQLIDDYGLAVSTSGLGFATIDRTSVPVVITDAPAPVLQDDVVDITFAPDKVTYKAKKMKKKAKSFTVEATAKSGKAVTYILKTDTKKISIDSATGKVTIAKGIKKGTYKIKVTARTEDGNGYKAAQDVANITVKIKK